MDGHGGRWWCGAGAIGKLGSQALDQIGPLGIVGEVGEFTRIVEVIVQLAARLSAIPLDVAPALGGDGAAHDLGIKRAQDLGESWVWPGGLRILQQRAQVVPGQRRCGRDACEAGQRGVNVDELDHAVAGLAARGGGDLRGHDDEWSPGGFIKEGAFLPQMMLAEVVAVIAPQHHHGRGPEVQLIHRLQQHADLGIDEAHAGEVGLKRLAEDLGRVAVVRHGDVVRDGGGRDVAGVFLGHLRELDAIQRLGIEVGLGRDVRCVRAEKACCQEKWRLAGLGEPLQSLHGVASDEAIGLFVVAAVGR